MARILVIEDNTANLELITYLLESFGHELLWASDGAEGLALARRERPALILCDIHLPTISGYEIARQLKADPAHSRIPLVAVTALAMVGDREQIMAAGFDGYLEKPLVPEQFVGQVEAFLPPVERTLGGRSSEPEPAPATAEAPRARGATILVIDDRRINTELLCSILEPSGYSVLTAASVQEAIASARAERPDLIVSDLHMPQQTGLDLLRTVRDDPELRGIRVIIHSATTQLDSDRRQALALGATAFLTGPLEPQEFLRELARSLQAAPEHPHGDDPHP